jgi:hypothetical protein
MNDFRSEANTRADESGEPFTHDGGNGVGRKYELRRYFERQPLREEDRSKVLYRARKFLARNPFYSSNLLGLPDPGSRNETSLI